MVGGEGIEREQVLFGLLEQRRDFRQRRAQPLQGIADELASSLARVGVEGRPEQCRDHPLLVFADVAERLAQEVHRAALPGAAEYLPDRLLEAGMRVGDDELDAREATLDQSAQEAAPEGLGLGLSHIERDHLPVARLVHPIGQHQRLAHDAAAVSDLLHLRVKPEVRVAALQRAVAEGVDLLVESGADPGNLRLRDPQPERLHHLVDLAGGDAGDVGLLHDRDKRLLGAAARLQEAREVRTATDLRDRKLDLAGPRRPRPSPVTVAVRQPLLPRPLTAGRADELGHLRLHQLLAHPGKRLAQEIKPLPLEQVADDLLSRHPLRLGHRGDSSRRRLGGLDESERHGGRTTRLRPTRSYTTLRDVTAPSGSPRYRRERRNHKRPTRPLPTPAGRLTLRLRVTS